VRLITTHISWVFVTDHEVWKLKRPVDYGFVDYTSLDQRRHFCHEEVRLNRRLAPDVYLGVVPVRLEEGRHSLTSNGTIVDYAVRMRRLPDAANAENLLRHGALTHGHLGRLAGRLAAFYASCAPGSRWGSLDVIRHNVEENFAQVGTVRRPGRRPSRRSGTGSSTVCRETHMNSSRGENRGGSAMGTATSASSTSTSRATSPS
jgi:aminoglycoside phosphotransferase family enzyme